MDQELQHGHLQASNLIYKLIHQDPPNKRIFFYYMFEINPLNNHNLTVKRVYDHSKNNDKGFIWRKIFVIDNFYKNPDQVRNYALSCELKCGKEYCGSLVGKRVVEDNQEMRDNLRPIFTTLCNQKEWNNLEYDEDEFQKKWDNMKFMVNHTTHDDIMDKFTDTVYCYTHHKDDIGYKWAALVYLNTDEECNGGTNFYRQWEDHAYGYDYNLKSDIMFTSEMKYNTMVLYEARQTHGAILDRKMYKQHPRLAQVFFM